MFGLLFTVFFGGSQKGSFQKGGFGGCSPGTKTGTRVRSPKPPFYETALLSPSENLKVLTKGWFPKGWFRRMFPRNENQKTNTRTHNSEQFEGTTHENVGVSRQKGPESSPELRHEHCHGVSLPYFLRPPKNHLKSAKIGNEPPNIKNLSNPILGLGSGSRVLRPFQTPFL